MGRSPDRVAAMARGGTESVVTVGGHRVAVAEYGDPQGRPVFFLHGTPACRLPPVSSERDRTR